MPFKQDQIYKSKMANLTNSYDIMITSTKVNLHLKSHVDTFIFAGRQNIPEMK